MKKEMSDTLAKSRGFKPYPNKSTVTVYHDFMDIILVIKENKFMFISGYDDKYILRSSWFEDFSNNEFFEKELNIFRHLVIKMKYEEEF